MTKKQYLVLFLRFLKENHLLVKFTKNYYKHSTSYNYFGKSLLNYINDKCDTKSQYFFIHGAFVFTDTEEGLGFWINQDIKWKRMLKNNEVIASIQQTNSK